MASEKIHSQINYLILILTPIIIIITLLIRPPFTIEIFGIPFTVGDDYFFYEQNWLNVLQGINPYPMCAYPIGFLAFAGFYFFYPTLPKVFFCLIWLLTIYLMNKICKKHNISNNTTIIFCVGWLLINPLYIGTTLIMGHFDILVGFCILLAVYSADQSEEIKSGIYTALVFLLKFVGLILAFPLVFMKKKINWRLGISALSISGIFYLFGFLFWGTSAFEPILYHIFREPSGSSIFLFFKEVLGIDLSPFIIPLLIIGVIIVIVFLYSQNNDLSTYSLIILICFNLILPVFYVQYLLWFLPLALYWSIKHNNALHRMLVLYFSVMYISVQLAIIPFLSELQPYFSILSFIMSVLFVIVLYLYRTKDKELKNTEGDN